MANFLRKDSQKATLASEAEEEATVMYEPVASGFNAEEADRKSETYNRIVRWIVALGVFLIPLFVLPWTSNVLEYNKQLLLIGVSGVALIVWLLGVVVSGQLRVRKNPIDIAVFAVLVASAISLLLSGVNTRSLFGTAVSMNDAFISVFGLSVLYLMAVHASHDRGRLFRNALIVSMFIALLFGLLQLFAVYVFPGGFTHSRVFNTIGSPNALGLAAAMMLPLFAKARLRIGNVRFLNLGVFGIVVSVITLAILNWWVLWIVAIAGMAAMIGFESVALTAYRPEETDRPRRLRIARFLLPMTVIVLGVFLWIVSFNVVAVKRNLPVEVSPSYRLAGTVTWQELKKDFISGGGIENFSQVFDEFGAGRLSNSTLANVQFYDAPSQALNVVSQGGLILGLGFLFLLYMFAIPLARFTRHRGGVDGGLTQSRTREDDDEETWMARAGAGAAVVAGIAAFFLYPFNLTLSFLWYAIIGVFVLAFWGGSSRVMNVEERASASLISSLGFIAGLIIVLAGAYFGVTRYMADVQYAKAAAAASPEEAADRIVTAINWDASRDRYYRFASQTSLGLLAQELNKQPSPSDTGRNDRIAGYVNSAISFARQATTVDSNESANWANLGSVYQNLIVVVDGSAQLAEDAFHHAQALRPGDPTFANSIGSMYLVYSDVLRQRGQAADSSSALVKAEEAFRQATEQSENFGIAIYNLGVVYERQGRLLDAIRQLERVAPFNSNQPGLAFELGLLYYRANQKDKALNVLQQAVTLAPDYSNARWYLALIHEERGELEAAVAQLEQIIAVDVNRDNPVVLTKLEALRQGKTSIPPEKVLDQPPIQ